MNAIGGDGFWLIREPGGRVRAIEACGYAGDGASIAAYRALGLDAVPIRGPKAALTVPGAVGGWTLALELSRARGGRLPLSLLLENAVRRARDGYPVSASEARFDVDERSGADRRAGLRRGLLCRRQASRGRRDPPQRRGSPTRSSSSRTPASTTSTAATSAREIAADLERIGAPITRDDLEALSRRMARAAVAAAEEGDALQHAARRRKGSPR